MAESTGFEPVEPVLRTLLFSKQPSSTTRPTLHIFMAEGKGLEPLRDIFQPPRSLANSPLHHLSNPPYFIFTLNGSEGWT